MQRNQTRNQDRDRQGYRQYPQGQQNTGRDQDRYADSGYGGRGQGGYGRDRDQFDDHRYQQTGGYGYGYGGRRDHRNDMHNDSRNDYDRRGDFRADDDRGYDRYQSRRGHELGARGDRSIGMDQREHQQRVWDSARHYDRGYDHGYEHGYQRAMQRGRFDNYGHYDQDGRGGSYDDDRYGFQGHGDYDRGPGYSEGYDDRYGGSGHRGYNQNRYGEASTTYGWDRRR